MTDLKLIALDEDDLGIISVHLQDAVIRVGDIAYVPHAKRFAALLARFDWVGAVATTQSKPASGGHTRRQSALRFERVSAASLHNIDLAATSRVLSLLTIQFEPGSTPGGRVLLIFAGGSAIRLDVECVEAELRDLGSSWRAERAPDHSGGGPENSDGEKPKLG